MQKKSCFFIGHRDTREEVFPLLMAEIERHITASGVRNFYVGHYGSFDRMAARAVIEMKKQYADIRLTMLLPYHPAIRPIELPAGFDGSVYPEGQEKIPYKAAISRANMYIIGRVDHLICYVDHPSNGSRAVMEVAMKRKVHVVNIAGWYPDL